MYNAQKMNIEYVYTCTYKTDIQNGYTKRFDETKYIFFLIKDDKLKEKYNNIWNKVSNSIRKWFDSETVYHEKYLKTKTKPYEGKINKKFHNNGIPKEGLHHISLSVMFIDSVS